MIVVDVDRRATIAYAMNKTAGGIIGDARGEALVQL